MAVVEHWGDSRGWIVFIAERDSPRRRAADVAEELRRYSTSEILRKLLREGGRSPMTNDEAIALMLGRRADWLENITHEALEDPEGFARRHLSRTRREQVTERVARMRPCRAAGCTNRPERKVSALRWMADRAWEQGAPMSSPDGMFRLIPEEGIRGPAGRPYTRAARSRHT